MAGSEHHAMHQREVGGMKCPRCQINAVTESGTSRATGDRDIEICGACCSDEAWIEHYGQAVPKIAAWPVARKYDELGQRAWV
jgi:hypothetical protein